MDQKTRIAVPSVAPGGIDARRSGHFGRCDCFTLVDIQNGRPEKVEVIENLPHTEGGCLAPVSLLAGQKANAIIVGGIGARPLQGFRQAGIEVLLAPGETVRAAIEAFAKGECEALSDDAVCGGH